MVSFCCFCSSSTPHVAVFPEGEPWVVGSQGTLLWRRIDFSRCVAERRFEASSQVALASESTSWKHISSNNEVNLTVQLGLISHCYLVEYRWISYGYQRPFVAFQLQKNMSNQINHYCKKKQQILYSASALTIMKFVESCIYIYILALYYKLYIKWFTVDILHLTRLNHGWSPCRESLGAPAAQEWRLPAGKRRCGTSPNTADDGSRWDGDFGWSPKKFEGAIPGTNIDFPS